VSGAEEQLGGPGRIACAAAWYVRRDVRTAKIVRWKEAAAVATSRTATRSKGGCCGGCPEIKLMVAGWLVPRLSRYYLRAQFIYQGGKEEKLSSLDAGSLR
jgi:hypothetical protein